jgi:hypothetical protein
MNQCAKEGSVKTWSRILAKWAIVISAALHLSLLRLDEVEDWTDIWFNFTHHHDCIAKQLTSMLSWS